MGIERLQDELQASNTSRQESGERAKLAIQELEGEILTQNKAQQELEEEMTRQQARLEEETLRHEDTCRQLEEARIENARVTDTLNSFEMDCQRLVTRHQDEGEELTEERNRFEDEKNQLEEQVDALQAQIVRLSAQHASMQKKCNLFKTNLKGLNEKNKAWEDSYTAQSNDLMSHGMEISRLNGRVSGLKSQLIRQGSGRYANQGDFPTAQTTPDGRSIRRTEARERYTF